MELTVTRPLTRASSGATTHVLDLRVQTVSLTSGHIHYIDEGAGPVVLLLHGAPLTSLGFMRVIRGLRAHYRVLAPDLPGFGGSTPAAGCPGTLPAYAAFIEEFCRTLRLRDFFAFVNDSSACMAFPALAALRSDVAGLIVADTVPVPMTGPFWLVKMVLSHVVSSAPMRWINRRANLLPWMVASVAPLLHRFSPEERAAILCQFDSPAKRDRVLAIFRQMGRDDAFMARAARAAREDLADLPTLLLYGQFDPMRILGAIPRYRQVFPRHTVRIVPREEHFPILASGARVATVVHDWIQETRGRG